jgi:transglutaminase-like putative cysteine protease
MRCKIEVLMTYDLPQPAEILLMVQVIPMADQKLVKDNLIVTGAQPMKPVIHPIDRGTRTWFEGSGQVTVDYVAEVAVERTPVVLAGKPGMRRVDLPAEALPYLFPSRYCESDRLEQFVTDSFGAARDGDQVEAMADWIASHLTYTAGYSTASTTAVDTFLSRRGVCRDYAHLMISFARAAGIPARAVSVYAPGLDPQDFHAVAEVYLDGGWHFVDPTRMAPDAHFVRIATGRDATDISFMTVFGSAMLISQRAHAFLLQDAPAPSRDSAP